MHIIGTGLSGLVGSRVVELLSSHTFVNLSLEKGIDITNKELVTTHINKETDASWVIHFAAYTNVQKAEEERGLGEKSAAWQINVAATQSIVDACIASNKRMLYVDTDYAFDGSKDVYTETDEPNPLGWYATTKSEGAKRVLSMGDSGVVIRISNPYRANPVGKMDFVHKMLARLANTQQIVAPNDQTFVPTFVDDIAYAIDTLLAQNASGIYHIVGSQALSPFSAALSLARLYGYTESLVKETTFHDFFANRAPIPKLAVLSNKKAASLGIRLRGFDEGIAEMKRQEKSASSVDICA